MSLVIIPAMGMSQRFFDEGWHGPKALLPITRGGVRWPMLRHVISSLPSDWSPMVVCHGMYQSEFSQVITDADRGGSLLPLEMPCPTRGQSETISIALAHLRPIVDNEIAVQNCDVVIPPDVTEAILHRPGSVVALHRDDGPDPVFSYVDHPDYPINFVEKKRISPWAMTGLWKFSSQRDLYKAIGCQFISNMRHTNGEFYLSAALNYLSTGMRGHVVREWCDWGTPAAVRASGCTIG